MKVIEDKFSRVSSMADELNNIKKRICVHFMKQKQQPSAYTYKISKFEEELFKQTQAGSNASLISIKDENNTQPKALPLNLESKASLNRITKMDDSVGTNEGALSSGVG
jgi:hypothetical protein